ncbi:uncharacterized protein Eint_060480 [Encephalitozoon intestinalis ATCC 50506]|uniref:Uncharacterized protein n=1 Tax=Encephalitozoon intestinalis (strain ATCC 50506) TaxID=876142 RepID=E0S7H7_ENCIT|nr:uncharacterized protein Eint_060480 [Encephalitozoon intestinalis ATCC 50506]ADM11656.1 hypothetical protein Eint_060480 [Encephalitozoon intestinalis ATCC 50506]UTX45390.1 hypothetical protein GPK93_06g09420 [Encephalitozoon intestinalis]
MDSGMKKRFIELLSFYGSDFDAIADTNELDGMTSEMLYSKYPEILDSYFLKNSPQNQEEINWLQIKEIYYMNGRFYFDVLMGELGGSHVIKNGRDLEVGKELVMLLKDYEFKLLSKLSILDRLYRDLYKNGMLSEDLGRRAGEDPVYRNKEKKEKKAKSSATGEGSVAKKKSSAVAVVVKSSQEAGKDAEDKEEVKDKDVKNSMENPTERVDGDEKYYPSPKQSMKRGDTIGFDYSAILRLSREQRK